MQARRIIVQALPIILLALIGEMVAGSVFGRMNRILAATPGLIVLVPALLLMRGAISATMGSRLSSAVHLGLIPGEVPARHPEVRTNINASLLLGGLMGVVAGILAHVITLAFGGDSAGVLSLGTIGLTVGFLSGLPMIPATVQAVRIAFRRGVDPDNVIGPILLTLGDITTIVLLFAIAWSLGVWF